MTSVVGKTKNDVVNSLQKYAESMGGGLEQANLSTDDDHCCAVEEAKGNTTLFYPNDYLEWDKSAESISRDLNAPVFSFHIHDGDLWMYLLFVNGQVVDRFNPIPDYWEEESSKKESRLWKGNPATIARYVSSVKPADIEKYLVRWNLDDEESKKAYAGDAFCQEDWQLLDFMKKLGLPYPLNDKGEPNDETYKLWTKDLPLQQRTSSTAKRSAPAGKNPGRPWWKFW